MPISLSEQVQRLLSSRQPDDAYKAYRLIQNCVWFLEEGDLYTLGSILPGNPMPQRVGLSPPDKDKQTQLCSGMTERMRTSRIDYLTIAAKAKVSGAEYDFYHAGPFGDPSALDSRPDDPLVKEWKQLAVAQMSVSINEGHYFCLWPMFLEYTTGSKVVDKDPVLALTYLLALQKITPGPPYTEAYFPRDPNLTAEQIAAANKAANDIVAANARLRAKKP